MENVKRVPVVLQMEAVECGAASLAMILAYYKRFIPLEKMRIDCNVTRDGSLAKYIVKAAAKHELETKAYKMDPEQIRQRQDFPMIIHWNFNHFVVLCGFRGTDAVINDPASGRIRVPAEVFDRSFTGIALCFRPGEAFERIGMPAQTGGFIKKMCRGQKAAFVFVIVLGAVYSLLNGLPPVFYKIFTDRILLGGSPEWLPALLLAMLATGTGMLLAGGLQVLFAKRLQAQLRIREAAVFFRKLLRLPAAFFDQRFCGDIVSRQQDGQEIISLFFERILPALMEVILMLCLYGLMFSLDVRMSCRFPDAKLCRAQFKPGQWKTVGGEAVRNFHDRDDQGEWCRAGAFRADPRLSDQIRQCQAGAGEKQDPSWNPSGTDGWT